MLVIATGGASWSPHDFFNRRRGNEPGSSIPCIQLPGNASVSNSCRRLGAAAFRVLELDAGSVEAADFLEGDSEMVEAMLLLSGNRTVTWTAFSSREVVTVPGALAASRNMLVLPGRISETNPRTPRLIAYSWSLACSAVPRPTP